MTQRQRDNLRRFRKQFNVGHRVDQDVAGDRVEVRERNAHRVESAERVERHADPISGFLDDVDRAERAWRSGKPTTRSVS